MKCPYCATIVHIDWNEQGRTYLLPDSDQASECMNIAHGACPQCGRVIIKLLYGPRSKSSSRSQPFREYDLDSNHVVSRDEIIYPWFWARPLPPEVPESYQVEYYEAVAVHRLSPKSSAALSRRLLQRILRDEYRVQSGTLACEISAFVRLEGIPLQLKTSVDAVRTIGNLAAHPMKDKVTGAIVDVEQGEAEWLLEILEMLLDFAFVQPAREAERKARLNEKLRELGKPPFREQ